MLICFDVCSTNTEPIVVSCFGCIGTRCPEMVCTPLLFDILAILWTVKKWQYNYSFSSNLHFYSLRQSWIFDIVRECIYQVFNSAPFYCSARTSNRLKIKLTQGPETYLVGQSIHFINSLYPFLFVKQVLQLKIHHFCLQAKLLISVSICLSVISLGKKGVFLNLARSVFIWK